MSASTWEHDVEAHRMQLTKRLKHTKENRERWITSASEVLIGWSGDLSTVTGSRWDEFARHLRLIVDMTLELWHLEDQLGIKRTVTPERAPPPGLLRCVMLRCDRMTPDRYRLMHDQAQDQARWFKGSIHPLCSRCANDATTPFSDGSVAWEKVE